jgi:DNA-directed RNA polymerase omega subunit
MNKDMSNSRGPDIDTDKCLEVSGTDRFSMVLIAAARAREIKRKNMHSVRREHIFPTVTALLEIQEGKIGKEYLKKI